MSWTSFVCTQLNGFKFCYLTQIILFSINQKWLNSSVWPLDMTLTSSTTLSPSGPGSNDNKGILHISQSFRTGASPSDAL